MDYPDFMKKSIILNHYKRKDVQHEMLLEAQDKEIAVSYGGKGYGKRPDALLYPNDILEMVKKGATSFHASEELWHDPLKIVTGARKEELDSLRKGWDLVIDIDCPYWDLAKINAWLIIKAIKEHGVKSVSCKFSGNKGFHIGVPFEAFPSVLDNKETRVLFPDDARRIAMYLLDYISKNMIEFTNSQEVIFGNKYKISFSKLKELTGKSFDELTKKVCFKCNASFNSKTSLTSFTEYLCGRCGYYAKAEGNADDFISCPGCGTLIEGVIAKNTLKCKCGSDQVIQLFDPLSIIEVDTILIAQRHLYRMSYSYHEKSGLVSIPINPDKVMHFTKELADPRKLKISRFRFLDRSLVVPGEATKLLISARDFTPPEEDSAYTGDMSLFSSEIEILEEALPEEMFPPCIKLMLNGLKDGRKRSLFVLVNFLKLSGWSNEMIQTRLYEWNKNNFEELRETILKGQIEYRKRKKPILPPNCNNKMYYLDLGVCKPDNLCAKIKNPVQYAKIKAKQIEENKKQTRSRKTKKKAKEKSEK